jgi:hypothetical protein
MKYVRTPSFLIDLRRLPEEHRKMFVQAVPDGRALFRLAEVAGETVVVWLRVGNHGIYDS